MPGRDTAGVQRWRRRLEGLVGVPATEGNRVDVLRNGDEIFPAMLDAVRSARRTVDIMTYVYWTGDVARHFADALSERARAGLRVRILLDAVGAYAMSDELGERMKAAGCRMEWFRPPGTRRLRKADHRNHRKVLIVDERVAFVGGVGIAREWEGDAQDPSHWRDTHLRVRGPAVDGLRAAFVGNWAETGRPAFDEHDRFADQERAGDAAVQTVACPSQQGWTQLGTVLHAFIGMAERALRVTTAYFVPDDHFRGMLCAAARRGVDVDVLVPGPHIDKRVVQVAGEADYAELLEAGVRVWRYQPTMLHAKVVTVDGSVACVGSANFDQRSLRLNEEANVVVFDPAVVATLDRHFAEDLALSAPVDPGRWARRGAVQRVKEKLAGSVDGEL
ncbi:MAG: phospholipase D-like domain-containing protein [Actinomycetota bacterium]|nr:phospholipase D-like domain-containing protein [Actinomycetota bacterium]